MPRNMKPQSNSESGYTIQTLIIIAILVLAATTAAALLYAVLRDSTSRIAGGSETFDGLPSGPQNLQVVSEPSGNDVDLTISWEAPSYLGEFPPTGYELSVVNNDNNMDTPIGSSDCDSSLETSASNFTYDNICEITIRSVGNDPDYDLVFTINLGSADARSSPGSLSFYRDLELTTETAPPSRVETSSLPDALQVSWDAQASVTYRLFVELGSTDYYQCFNSNGGQITREIPNIRNREASPPGTATLQKGQEYTVSLAAASRTLTLDAANCSNNSNFGTAISFTGSFGIPATPEITLETDLARTVDGSSTSTETLPSLKATLASCDADSSTTFFWEIAGQPQTQNSYTVQGCGAAACASNCAITIYEDFALETEYEVWAVAENTVGASGLSQRQRWFPTRASASIAPSPPRNINTISEGSLASSGGTILISWDAPAFIPDSGIRGYILKSEPKPSGAPCSATFGATSPPTNETFEIPADTLQHRFAAMENHKAYCFQLSAFSIDSSQAEAESDVESFEAIYVNPLSRGAGEFLLDWRANPRAEYYTISWAPLTSDTACTGDPTAADLQPSNFLSATIPYNGEETLTYTIPAIHDTYYLVRSAATLQNGATVSWQSHICTNLYNAPPIPAGASLATTQPEWTGTTTAGTAIGIQWTRPNETADDFDKRYSLTYSYALRVTHTTTGGTISTEYRCIGLDDSVILSSTSTPVSRSVNLMSVAGTYQFWLTVAPSSECSSDSDAMSIIDSPSDLTPPIRTGTRTIM